MQRRDPLPPAMAGVGAVGATDPRSTQASSGSWVRAGGPASPRGRGWPPATSPPPRTSRLALPSPGTPRQPQITPPTTHPRRPQCFHPLNPPFTVSTLLCFFFAHLILPLIPVSDSAWRLWSLCNLEKNILLTFLDFKEHNYILISDSPVIIPDTESFECRAFPANVISRYSNEETEHERETPNLQLTFGLLLKKSFPR